MKRLERFLLVVGGSMLAVYLGMNIYRMLLSHAEIERFKSRQVLAQELRVGSEAIGKAPDFSLWSPKRIQGYQASLMTHFSPAIALLRVPKIHLEVPVLEGTDELSLNRAVGHIVGTAGPGSNGNIGIAGHRDGFFRGLKDVAIGDKVEIATESETYTYVIDQIEIVDPSDVAILAPRPLSSVTLVTCYPFYFVGSAPQRYIVQASRMASDQETPNATASLRF